MGIISIILESLWFILPAYLANSSPVLGHKLFGKYNYPIDFGKKLKDGKRILGDGKTWNGLIFGILVAVLVGYILSTAQASYGLNGFVPMSLELDMLANDRSAKEKSL